MKNIFFLLILLATSLVSCSSKESAPTQAGNIPAGVTLDVNYDAEDENEEPGSVEKYNRWMTDMNDFLYQNLLFPIARGYRTVTTKGGRTSTRNFFKNLLFPVRFANNVMQAKFACAGKELLRFCINSTIGFFGLFDPAKDWFEIQSCEEDFGQTLGFWGVAAGPHIVLPFLGPSNLRDITGSTGDSLYDPLYQIRGTGPRLSVIGFRGLTNDVDPIFETYDGIKKDAFDLYLFLRDAYEQSRNKLIEE